jgi:hypothetical protein
MIGVLLVLIGPLAVLFGRDSHVDDKEWRRHTD